MPLVFSLLLSLSSLTSSLLRHAPSFALSSFTRIPHTYLFSYVNFLTSFYNLINVFLFSLLPLLLFLSYLQSGRWYIPGPLLPPDGLRDVRGGVGNGQQGWLYQRGQTGERHLRWRLWALWPAGLRCCIQVSVMKALLPEGPLFEVRLSRILNPLNAKCVKGH